MYDRARVPRGGDARCSPSGCRADSRPPAVPTAPNGSKYARSPPVQPEVKIVKDFGKEAPFSWY